jgi:DUF4097 and DUF4098 domain-containing protein YvlB
MLAQVHTIHSSNGSLTIHASRLENVNLKTASGNTFRNATCIYYTVVNHVNGIVATYAEMETMPNTLTRNVVSFMYEKMQRYMTREWFTSYGDIVVEIEQA